MATVKGRIGRVAAERVRELHSCDVRLAWCDCDGLYLAGAQNLVGMGLSGASSVSMLTPAGGVLLFDWLLHAESETS